ncbi:hypothetical protein MRX96_012651 [Rhipicephalus microplus]
MATIAQTTEAPQTTETEAPSGARVVLRLRKPPARNRRHVAWTEGTVDNEHMNRLKSKCCCVYVKPHKFGESSSDSEEEECEHCRGHVERRQRNKKPAGSAVVTATPETMSEWRRRRRTACLEAPRRLGRRHCGQREHEQAQVQVLLHLREAAPVWRQLVGQRGGRLHPLPWTQGSQVKEERQRGPSAAEPVHGAWWRVLKVFVVFINET